MNDCISGPTSTRGLGVTVTDGALGGYGSTPFKGLTIT